MFKKLARHFDLQFDFDLQPYNSFGIKVGARAYVQIHSTKQLQHLLSLYNGPIFVLGGGSNLLFTNDVDALVVHNRIMGKERVRTFPKSVYVRAGAGENWQQFVCWAIGKGWGGIENLSLIPGTVGAAPIQNIGAYGVELQSVFRQLKAVDLTTGKLHIFRSKDCRFGYRDSIFKRQLKDRFFICEVTVCLSRFPKINTSYGAIRQTLADMQVDRPGISDVSKAVIQIRSSKLPDPAKIGNAGSFFKNPEVDNNTFTKIQQRFPEMPFYPLPEGRTKIPAGWLIEQCGWKGKRIGDAGCHQNQALVLVNHGHATGAEIYHLAQKIKKSVQERFGVELMEEVRVVG